ncbi:Na+/H+ antiporter NhaA [Permianibacter aggregans]|uniref:Na(+)/H(+) antiporter NhaA n=1 Tax=Permianibacter aggregans TaxID=1510150 RepID=A0A4R6UPV7_9GAMM|nr:Na+/H+ antiporter NhaA [Permianibacter aggregans]QGX40144.1 Na+/H+ antiporter NhaA [Permianibacter aggregans]TDQ49041.1 sodium/proton antiporter (NhaA family) [Permianibacter aggregans]
MPLRIIQQFLRLEASSGMILLLMAVLAMIAANSPLASYYDALLNTRMGIHVGEAGINKPLLLWINDGLMAVFFFLVGLELKREIVIGELSAPANVVLPGMAAVGGFVMPALVYAFINQGDPANMAGWAIPAATDIAFALGILALLGSRVPKSLKLFLMTLAIIDDLLAIVVIAVFYSGNLSQWHLIASAICIAALALMSWRGVNRAAPYILVGLVFWVMVLKSGVHATLAGVITAFFIPMKNSNQDEPTVLESLEHNLHPYVAYLILPIFGFANAGVSLAGLKLDDVLATVPLGIALGLLIGKLVGVTGMVMIARMFRLAPLPSGAQFSHIIGVALLCGVGFTMSLFIASLAFEAGGNHPPNTDRLGILLGSIVSGTLGYLVLRFVAPKAKPEDIE